MGFFRRLLAQPITKTTNKKTAKYGPASPVVVQVVHCRLTEPVPSDGGRYLYRWPLEQPPRVGDRVRVSNDLGGGFAVVCAIGASRRDIAMYSPLKPVTRVVPPDEVDRAHAKLEADTNAWLNMARREAGLKTTTRRQNVPKGFPEVPPATGNADVGTANHYGAIWWRLHKTARDDAEAKAFLGIAIRWYAVRDKGGNLAPPAR